MSVFSKKEKDRVEPKDEFDVGHTDVQELKEMVAQLADQNKGLSQKIEDLTNQNVKILEEQKKAQETVKIENCAKSFGIKGDDLKNITSLEGTEDKLWALLENAQKFVKEIKNGLEQPPVGDLETEDLIGDSKQPKNIDEALNRAQADKPDLKGEELTNYARAAYPSAFNVKQQYENIQNFIQKVGD